MHRTPHASDRPGALTAYACCTIQNGVRRAHMEVCACCWRFSFPLCDRCADSDAMRPGSSATGSYARRCGEKPGCAKDMSVCFVSWKLTYGSLSQIPFAQRARVIGVDPDRDDAALLRRLPFAPGPQL